METKTSTLNRINELTDYCIGQGRDEDKMLALMVPLKNAVSAYFNVDIKASVEKAIEAITHGLIRTGIIYTDGSSNAAGGIAPAGWDNIIKVFEDIDTWLKYVDFEVFNSSINEVTPPIGENDESATPDSYYQSSLVDNWIIIYNDACTSVITSLGEVATYGNSIGLGNTIQQLLEPKEVAVVPSLKDIAIDIYVNRGYKELIEFKELGVYVPESIGGGH